MGIKEIIKGAAIVLLEAGLAAWGIHPFVLVGSGLVLLLLAYWPNIRAWKRGRAKNAEPLASVVAPEPQSSTLAMLQAMGARFNVPREEPEDSRDEGKK